MYSLDAILKRAESGNGFAQIDLGRMYSSGNGVPQDLRKAIYWYESAFAKGFVDAKRSLCEVYLQLGRKYYYGNGVSLDHRSAVSWFEKAAELGNTDAHHLLIKTYRSFGDKYIRKAEKDGNYGTAISWYIKAADLGDAGAQLALGNLYLSGAKEIQDYYEAAIWFRKSAENGNIEAMSELGDMYMNGLGVTKKYSEAIKWFHKANEIGSSSAQEKMGRIYENGIGVPKDIKLALTWYEKAFKNGSLQASADVKRCSDYIKKMEIRIQRNRRNALQEIHNRFKVDFLNTDTFYNEKINGGILSKDEYKKEKISFVKSWIQLHPDLDPIDDRQAKAIVTIGGNIKVEARAGSGKTSTLVNRTLFLMKHCRILPEQILILAFNRDAIGNVRNKLKLHLKLPPGIDKQKAIPHIATFHSLAYSFVKRKGDLVYDEEKHPMLSGVVHETIEELKKSMDWEARIRGLMLGYFKTDWDESFKLGLTTDRQDVIRRLRSGYCQETLGGEYVRSYGQKAIANFLFENDVDYKYEKARLWDSWPYRPDFTIDNGKFVIAYYDFEGDKYYDRMTEMKVDYWRKRSDYTFVDINRDQIRNGSFKSILEERLKVRKIPWRALSEDEMWDKIKVKVYGDLTKTLVQFLNRCRQNSLTQDELYELIAKHKYDPKDTSFIEKQFYEIAHQIYILYLLRLKRECKEDFNGLVEKASQKIEEGQTTFNKGKAGRSSLASLKYILVDEFQDFSPLFYRLLKSIQDKIPNVEMFCVGDSWQAINRFAGSDLKFINSFDRYFTNTKSVTLNRNYRSNRNIVGVSNRLMAELGEPAEPSKDEPGEVLVANLNSLSEYQSQIGLSDYNRGLLKSGLLRLINKVLNQGLDVVILCRKNKLDFIDINDYLGDIKREFRTNVQNSIDISTTHKYKGMQRPAVIVLADEYPFTHPHWIFNRLFGDTVQKIDDDERRLFYVALSRAKESLYLITNGFTESHFIEDLQIGKLSDVQWSQFPLPSEEQIRVVRITGTTYSTYSDLKLRAEGYTFNSESSPRNWSKSIQGGGNELVRVLNEGWVSRAKELTVAGRIERITVQILDVENAILDEIQIHNGRLSRRNP